MRVVHFRIFLTLFNQSLMLSHKIFAPYFSTKIDGKVIGLSIVYNLLKTHYGAITVNSTLGVGTVFSIYILSK